MDIQDHTTPTPSGHGSHGVHLCHRCGWPFPNPHPSSKHRRAHNRICGTIEGYTQLIHSKPVSDDEDHSDSDDPDKYKEKEKTPSPRIEKRIIKETGSSASGIEERSITSEDDPTKLLHSPTDVEKPDENLEVFESPDIHSKDAGKTEEIDVNNAFDPKTSVPSVEDKDETCKDKNIDIMELPNTSQTKPEMAEASENKEQGEEAVYLLSVPNDIPLVHNAETLIEDFKDHKTLYSDVPNKDVENRSIVDTFEVKTAEGSIHESQTSEAAKSNFSAFVPTVVSEEAKVAETEPSEMSKTISDSTDNVSEVEVIKKDEIDDSVPVLTDANTQETVKEPESGNEVKQKMTEIVVSDLKDGEKIGVSERSEEFIEEKGVKSQNASGINSESLVDEGDDGKVMMSQDFGVDPSVGSSSRNSMEGNWGSVSVLSTASIDAENSHSIGKSEISSDKSRLGKSDAFEDLSFVKPKEEIIDKKPSEMKAITVKNSQPPKDEANVGNETEGRKRDEAIAKVTNWSANQRTTTPLKNLVKEAKASNPKQLPIMVQKDEPAKKTNEPEKSSLTPKVNQESSPLEYIGEGKKVNKKSKGRVSWMPFGCCSSVNVN